MTLRERWGRFVWGTANRPTWFAQLTMHWHGPEKHDPPPVAEDDREILLQRAVQAEAEVEGLREELAQAQAQAEERDPNVYLTPPPRPTVRFRARIRDGGKRQPNPMPDPHPWTRAQQRPRERPEHRRYDGRDKSQASLASVVSACEKVAGMPVKAGWRNGGLRVERVEPPDA